MAIELEQGKEKRLRLELEMHHSITQKKKKNSKPSTNHIPFGFRHGKGDPLLHSKILDVEPDSLRCENPTLKHRQWTEVIMMTAFQN